MYPAFSFIFRSFIKNVSLQYYYKMYVKMYHKIIKIKLKEVFDHVLQDALVSAVGRQIFG